MSAQERRRDEAPKSAARMRKADRKRQLVAHAKQLFVTLGYQDTTTERIASAAGVSEPVLYRHFESKGDLYAAVSPWSSRSLRSCLTASQISG